MEQDKENAGLNSAGLTRPSRYYQGKTMALNKSGATGGLYGLGAAKSGNSSTTSSGLMQRLVMPFRKSTSSTASRNSTASNGSGGSTAAAGVVYSLRNKSDSANLSSNVSQVSFAVGAAGEREGRVSNGSAGSAGSSSGLSVSTGQGSLLSDASSVISLKSMGDQLLTYPHSVGVTPARKKALANISKMNHRGLENRVAKQIMAEQQRKVQEAYGKDPDRDVKSQNDEQVYFDADTDDGESFVSAGHNNFDNRSSTGAASLGVLSEAGESDVGVCTKCSANDDRSHPIFGELLADFQYKRVYKASGRQLCASVPIWHLQRPTDPSRVAALVASKSARRDFQGVISIFEFDNSVKSPSLECPQKSGVFDGQHRILAINQILKKQQETDCDEDIAVLVEVYPVRSEVEVKRLFQDINKAEMVQEIDLPNHLAGGDKVIIDEACAQLQARYPDMFKGERCRAPHVNLAVLRNELFTQRSVVLGPVTKSTTSVGGHQIDQTVVVDSAEKLLELIQECNTRLASMPKTFWSQGLQRNLPKAERHAFFLGMSKDWIHTVLAPLRSELATQGQQNQEYRGLDS